MKVYEVTSSSL